MQIVPLSHADHERYDALIADIERRFDVPPGTVTARSRQPNNIAPRHSAFWALHQSGLTCAQIARLFGLNHATIVHGVAHAELHPEWCEKARTALTMADGLRAALARWLDRGLAGLPAREREAVESYVLCTVLAMERRPALLCAYGLVLVLERSWVRAAVDEALGRCDLAAYRSSLAMHQTYLARRA